MKTAIHAASAALLAAALISSAAAEELTIRMLKVYPVGSQTCVSTSLVLPQGQALSGLTWYANDSQVSFPMVVLLEGVAGQAPDLTNAAMILAEVSGESLVWGSLTLDMPVISSTGRVDVVFFYPPNTEIQALGAGGGPGIGMVEDAQAQPPHLSPDGYTWSRFESGYRLAVDPVLAAGKTAAGAVLLGSLSDSVDRSRIEPRPIPEHPTAARSSLSIPYPNPFNPRTVIRLELPRPGPATVAIYDVRGRRITTLLEGMQAAGAQELIWQGTDSRGKAVASGAYFVVLSAEGERHRHKLTLLR